MKANQATYPVSLQCRILGVSTSGYYAWRDPPLSARAQQDQDLIEEIRKIHRLSRRIYGSPRVYEDLSEKGIRVGRKRVARLMRAAGLQGVSRRKKPRTTTPDAEATSVADLVKRDFTVEGPDRLWVADITYVPTWEGFLYLVVVVDAWHRSVVGWSMATHRRTELMLEALNMALWRRRPTEVIHHPDYGSPYTSVAFGKRCSKAGVRPSMGSVGDCYDNALCESFFATVECALLDRMRFGTSAEARSGIFEFIEGWYNTRRRHSSIDYLSPVEYERRHYAAS